MGAAFLKCPELILAREESEQLAIAINRVNELYDFGVIPEKAMAWIQLAMTAGTIYGPRAVSVYARNKQPKSKLVSMPSKGVFVDTNGSRENPSMN